MISIMLVDDHALFRTALGCVLKQAGDIEVIDEAASGEEALEKARKLTADLDLVLMDIKMPGLGGIETTRRFFKHYPHIRVLVLTAFDKPPFPKYLMEAGASGFLSKNCDTEEFFAAIHAVMAGNMYLSNQVAQNIALNRMVQSGDGEAALKSLSAREAQVMMMIVQGDSNKTICEALFLSPKTISTYRRRLYEKLGVSNDVELTHFALHHHVI